ncbi:MAG: FAD-dependent oxidoreductase [Lentisphaeria bacterium]|nr:FAD-dependent oxidoreductase [Lentisphaeria bacterium]
MKKTKEIPSVSYDVIVAGAGVAGVAASLAAAEEGAKVALIEKTIFPGGLATTGLVFFYLQLCDGKGTQVSYGLVEKLLKASIKYGPDSLKKKDWGKTPWKPEDGCYCTEFAPGAFILAMDELLEQAGVDFWLDTLLVDAETDENEAIHAVYVENKSGRIRLEGKAFVDATGDSDLVRRAGGETTDGMNYTCMWAVHHDLDADPKEFGKHFPLYYFPEKECNTHGVSGREVTGFVLRSRALLRHYYDEKYASGAADRTTLYPLILPAMPQYRKISCIVGKYRLHDGQAMTRFDDSIGMAGDWRNTANDPWEIPYSTMIPEKIRNVAAAGRNTSSEGEAWEITRVIPCAVVTGEAAGVAAALAVKNGVTVDEVPYDAVARCLVRRGVKLHLSDVGLKYK